MHLSAWLRQLNHKFIHNYANLVSCLSLLWKTFQDGVWFNSLDYKMAVPDPLRDSAESIIHEINTNNMEDIHRFCNIYVDLNFQVITLCSYCNTSISHLSLSNLYKHKCTTNLYQITFISN